MLVGVTGGIASGKTTVCRIFREFGGTVIDADRIGKQIVEEDEAILSKLIAAFGREILTEDRSLNRRHLGKLAFGNSLAKKKLDKILHPPLLQRLNEAIAKACHDNPGKMIVVDAALLVEWGITSWFDALVVVVANRKDQIQRLVTRDGLSLKEIEDRIRAQLPVEEKVELADYVILNDGDYALLCKRSAEVWGLLSKSAAKLNTEKH